MELKAIVAEWLRCQAANLEVRVRIHKPFLRYAPSKLNVPVGRSRAIHST